MRETAVNLLFFFNGQYGNTLFLTVSAGLQKGSDALSPTECRIFHQLHGILQQLGLLIPEGLENQFFLGREEGVKVGETDQCDME